MADHGSHQHERRARYGRYTGGPDPLAPPVDLSDALREISEDVMAGYSPEHALREYLRRGMRGQNGLDDLSAKLTRRRRELLRRHNLGGTLDEIKRLLDKAVLDERKQLARDVRMDDDDRALREMQLSNLPQSPAAAVNELANYDWQSSDARQTFEQIKDLLGRELLDQRFAGMKQALQGATDEDRAAVAQMLQDLNELLDKHRRGEDTPEDFQGFMDAHGDYFRDPTTGQLPRNVDELIDAMAQRSAAAQRMLNSMSAEQRAELMELSQAAFGSPELMSQLASLDANLQALRPGEDWTGSEHFSGQQGMGLGDATGMLQDIAELDNLADQLGQSYGGSQIGDVDLDALARQLGPEAAASAQTLAEIEKALRSNGLLRRGSDGDLRLSPRAMRQLGKSLLADAAKLVSGRSGSRETRRAGAAGEQTGATRAWEFGDTEPWDVTRTITNAIQRAVAEGGEPSAGLRLRIDDVEVAETEARTQSAVALCVDTSFSMAMEGRWVPMKRTALALHHLLATRFRGDALQLITFGRYAQSMEIEELTGLPPVQEQGTNLHHALLLADRFFAAHATQQPILLVVTDGEPTAHLEPDGESWFFYPPTPETIALTVVELDKLGRRGVQTTFFRLGDDPALVHFLDQLAARVDGRVLAPSLDELGGAVVGEYLTGRGGRRRASGAQRRRGKKRKRDR